MADLYRVVGTPGSGKTTFLSRQVEKWVETDSIEPERIVLTSFTRTAARVLQGRIPVPAQNAATLHSLAYRALGRPPIAEAEPALLDEWNGQPQLPPDWRVGKRKLHLEDDAFVEMPGDDAVPLLSRYSQWRAVTLGEGQLPHELRAFVRRWEAFKTETGSIDFQDMVMLALRDVDVCPSDPDCFVVDEAQDLNPAQWALAHRWGAAAHYSYVVAGDPAQCLYDWIGADPSALLTALPPDHHRLLGRSYRNPAEVQGYAEQWLRRHSGSMCDGREVTPAPHEGGVYRMPEVSWQDPEALVGAALQHIAAGETMAVLATCSFYLTPLLEQLRHFGVPFHNPYRPVEGRWNPLRVSEDRTTTTQRLRLFLARPVRGPQLATALEALPAAHFVTTRKAALERLQGLGVVDSLAGILREDGAAAWAARDGGWYAAQVKPEMQRAAAFAWAIYRRDPAWLDREPQVVVGTIHSLKGGEADHVYLFPDMPRRHIIAADEDVRLRDALVRQWYVGLTRARRTVVICDAANDLASMEAL